MLQDSSTKIFPNCLLLIVIVMHGMYVHMCIHTFNVMFYYLIITGKLLHTSMYMLQKIVCGSLW